MATDQEQVESGMIENYDGLYCVCVDPKSRFYSWLFYKHKDGGWVTSRIAFAHELQQAQKKYEQLKVSLDIPSKG